MQSKKTIIKCIVCSLLLLVLFFVGGCGAKVDELATTPHNVNSRILSHKREIVDVAPQRMNIYLRANFAQKKKPRLVRVWEVRKPRVTQQKTLHSNAVNTQAYFTALGIRNVYELSPEAWRLFLPRVQTSEFSPLQEKSTVHAFNDIKPGIKATLTSRQWENLIQEAGQKFGLDTRFIAAMIKIESNFNHLAVSPAGAQGAMQIMPDTQKQLGLNNPFDVRANIQAGCAFMRELLKRYGSSELALAAYNAGPSAVDKYRGIPPYAETRAYVRKVMNLWQGETTKRGDMQPVIHKIYPRSRVLSAKDSSR